MKRVAGVLTVVFCPWSASTRHTVGTRLCCKPTSLCQALLVLILDIEGPEGFLKATDQEFT